MSDQNYKSTFEPSNTIIIKDSGLPIWVFETGVSIIYVEKEPTDVYNIALTPALLNVTRDKILKIKSVKNRKVFYRKYSWIFQRTEKTKSDVEQVLAAVFNQSKTDDKTKAFVSYKIDPDWVWL